MTGAGNSGMQDQGMNSNMGAGVPEVIPEVSGF